MTDDYEVDVGTYAGIDAQKIASEELFKTAVRAQAEWRQNLRTGQGMTYRGKPYVDTGEAVNDITIQPAAEGALEYVIGGDTVQLVVAEHGRAPGRMPPFDAVAAWAKRKGLQPEEGQSFESMVYAIQHAIGTRGLPAFAPAERAHLTVIADLDERIRTRLEAEMQRATRTR